MEQDHPLAWSDIAAPGDDDFSSFLEFGMHFPDLEGHGSTDHHSQRSVISIPTSAVQSAQEHLVRMDTDTIASQPSSYNRVTGDYPVDNQGHAHLPISPYSNTPMTPAFLTQKSQFLQQSHPQQPSQDHSHRQSHCPPPSSQPYIPHGQQVIPPTPNSVELQGNAATYPQRVEENHEMYDRYARFNEEQALYTPLVSPAMTPLEAQFRLPEYTIPGEYFTPLTSPALDAQNANSNSYPFPAGQMSDVGFVPSSTDNAIPTSSAPSSPGLAKKHRRRTSTTKTFTSRAKKQQSPSARPQSRKKSLLNINSDEVLNGLTTDQGGPRSKPLGSSGLRYGSNESSGPDSVSPEPLSEPLMPPPALPPARRSPAVGPQANQSDTSEPATPAMLMRIQRTQHSPAIVTSENPTQNETGSSKSHDTVMEDVVLPEAMTPAAYPSRPQVTRIDTTFRTDASSATASASVTPALELKSASTTERSTSSVAPSPRSIAMPSPNGPVGKKSDTPKLGPMNRKRQSLSSTQASPNLRPKISPSIQPLVRGDGLSNETSALYLASKSNYQHILDGTLLPGVSYPETLAENLSSKRTNHKLAEQGRRNRINNALKEIETLIPPEFFHHKNAKEDAICNAKGGEKEKEKTATQQISKASTVEMAIDYIKALKQELEETKGKLKTAEARLETSKRRDGEVINTESEDLGESAQTERDQVAEKNGTV
ncbi:hypothetical protein EYZ11_007013 [Aspergillus tanneri]|uniref:BHLH domain-containing protein n=1 Tax=Aspergillus tanneri TaxID=1220188 RepID=A0A4S3JEE1_9EURO|nr:uncharacterized protein ATNIH1004_006255 [Aspergillus tanneri]KAA8647561.1 hypothetical protein ATNIH1004_006255 [Aspergillus tanneri]THC93522.1 hypothetical protein EYZ11_007013 [Aspergillus tanneri]